MPIMDLVGGPQGGGKSTFFPVAARPFDAFNIDDHRKRLNQGNSQAIPADVLGQARRDYEAFIEDHIRRGVSFSVEVTLGKEVTFEQAVKARRAGFCVQLTYIAAGLGDCIERVENRVEAGGHGVCAAVIHTTYEASLKNLVRALREFDLVEVYDNSRKARPADVEECAPRLVLEAQRGRVIQREVPAPDWLKSVLKGTEFDGG